MAYHALDLRRTADHLGVALVGKPRVYPGTPIQLAAQAICRLQHELGWGHALALDFTLAVQRSLWVEEGNVYDLEHLKDLARRVGIEEEMVGRTVVDRLTDEDDEGVKQWKENLRVAEDLGEWLSAWCEGARVTRLTGGRRWLQAASEHRTTASTGRFSGDRIGWTMSSEGSRSCWSRVSKRCRISTAGSSLNAISQPHRRGRAERESFDAKALPSIKHL